MTIDHFNSLSQAEKEQLVLHQATLVRATVNKDHIELTCDLNDLRFSALIDLQTDAKTFSALERSTNYVSTETSRTLLTSPPIHKN